MKKISQRIQKITFIAIFCAITYLCSVILPIKVMFLTLDFKDAISVMCGFFFGPSAGLFCAVAVPFIEFATASDTGVYGLIMNLLSSVTFVSVSTLIYKYKKTIFGAVLGLISATFSLLAVMMLANMLITPYYMHITTEQVIEYIPKLFLPFNTVKAILNGSIAMLLYKPISTVLKKMGVTRSFAVAESASAQDGARIKAARTALVTAISVLMIACALFIIFKVLGGKI